MNHSRITAEAIRFRLSTFRHPAAGGRPINVEQMAAAALNSGAPEVATALRRIAIAWRDAGMNVEDMASPWNASVAQLFGNRPDLVDALDDILVSATQPAANAA